MHCHSFFGSCFLFEIAKNLRCPLSTLGDSQVSTSRAEPFPSGDFPRRFHSFPDRPTHRHSPPVFILGFSDVHVPRGYKLHLPSTQE